MENEINVINETEVINSEWQLVSTKWDWLAIQAQLPPFTPLALVPTMGNLHAGHLSLISHALSEFSWVVVSIYVNQLQFGPSEDFGTYPRTLKEDCEKISALLKSAFPAGKRLIVYAPQSAQEVFPPGHSTSISVGPLSKILCGIQRPTHFDGVTTVVYALFALLSPSKAFFGLKDFQQFFLIKKMVHDLSLNIALEGVAIMRDSDSLALSSRNAYLTQSERGQALQLIRTLHSLAAVPLQHFAEVIKLKQKMQTIQTQDPKWEYLEMVDAQTLLAPTATTQDLVLLGAYRVGKTRLIDNLILTNYLSASERSSSC